MFEIKVSKEIKDACPVFAGAAVYAAVKNTAYSEGLWQEIDAFTGQLTSTTQMEDIKHQLNYVDNCRTKNNSNARLSPKTCSRLIFRKLCKYNLRPLLRFSAAD